MTVDRNLLLENLASLGINVSGPQMDKLEKYAGLLIETNKKFNLTAITDPAEIAVKHFADSLSVLTVPGFSESAAVIDIGTGAGFPGVPLIIACSDIRFTLLDSTGKKLNFIRDAIDSLGLSADIIHARAEELGRDSEYRECFDFAISRAVASLNVLCEYALPFVKAGGSFIAMKGAKADEEIKSASNSVSTLGGKLAGRFDIKLSDSAERKLVEIKKVSSTPPKYPRPGAQISKKPL